MRKTFITIAAAAVLVPTISLNARPANKRATEANYSNCMAGLETAKKFGFWATLNPSQEECQNFADDLVDKVEAKRRALIDDEIRAMGIK